MDRLIDWYIANCDGDWEHQYGFEIVTYDNPAVGIKITFDFNETESNFVFGNIVKDIGDECDWIRIDISKTDFKGTANFEGTGSPNNFTKIIDEFFKLNCVT
jgi:hypothetical protein